MKKMDLNIGMAVDFKKDGAIDSGIIADKGVYQAKLDMVSGDGSVKTVGIPYKDIVGLSA